jgi:hypothetical protein
MRKRIFYYGFWAFALFAILLTLFTLFDVIIHGKAQIKVEDLIGVGITSIVCFIILYIRLKRLERQGKLHGKGESWHD